jgi:alpha-glutamyl/putrescinyl thymine pyrophosphorylase-like protein
LILADRLVREPYPGLSSPSSRERFADELANSIRLIEYLNRIGRDPGSVDVREPTAGDQRWSPPRAIAQWAHAGRRDEATWLAFLVTFFGPDERRGHPDTWLAARSVYSGFDDGRIGWRAVSGNPALLAELCARHAESYEQLPRGNHRKYEPKRVDHRHGLAESVRSFVELVMRHGGIEGLFGGDNASAEERFDRLMRELSGIVRFGRTGRFDFLALLGDLFVWELRAGRLYLSGATGPLDGARRMLGRSGPIYELDRELTDFALRLGVPIQAIEDALCNWQKD